MVEQIWYLVKEKREIESISLKKVETIGDLIHLLKRHKNLDEAIMKCPVLNPYGDF